MRGAAAVVALLLVLPAGPAAAQTVVYTAQSLGAAKSQIHLDAAWLTLRPPWEEALEGRGIRIGLIDTGLDGDHPDLQGVLACGHCWRDFVGDGAGKRQRLPYDDHGHGTHVAGILAARGHFQPDPLRAYWLTGARGIAPSATLIVAKAMDAQGEGADDRVAAAIRWVVDPDQDPGTPDGADIINLSLGIASPPDTAGLARRSSLGTATREAIEEALALGVPVVASSGNDGEPRLREPGDIPGVITVAAVDSDGHLAAFSNRGAGLDLLAPGVLVSTYPAGLDRDDHAADGYVAMAGTSMAAPVVAGTIALLMEAAPALRPGEDRRAADRVQQLLRDTALPLPDHGGSAGILNAQGALATVVAAPGAVPLELVLAYATVALAGVLLVGLAWGRFARRSGRSAATAPAAAPAALPALRPVPAPAPRPAPVAAPSPTVPLPLRAPAPRPAGPPAAPPTLHRVVRQPSVPVRRTPPARPGS